LSEQSQEKAFDAACEQYAARGVDVHAAFEILDCVPISLHCWQGDDVAGFEAPDAALSGGGIAVTGNHPGRARTIDELRLDLEKAFSLIPGHHRLNLHAIYGDFGGKKVDRDRIGVEHFESWVDWARTRHLGLDFNATCFSHALAESGSTLSSADEGVRRFWVEHVRRCREIAAWMGRELGGASIHNLWIPDGTKDATVTRYERRERLRTSLDEIFLIGYPAESLADSVESKLFGIGSESFVAGSHDFYLAWALRAGVMVCLDMGHYHPTESVADKVSSLLPFFDEILLHVSRGVRWDSDHVVVWSDELRDVAAEIVRAGALGRVHLALDYFDASLNRVGAWVIGARAALKAMLFALLEPTARLREMEAAGDGFGRLAMLEEMKTLPFGTVWDAWCLAKGVPEGDRWIEAVRDYEETVLSKRS